MSFTHLPHDECAYKHRLLESVGPGEYMLDKVYAENCKACFVPSAGVRLGKYGVAVCDNTIDVDSELLGLTRQKSKCPGKQIVQRGKLICSTNVPNECNELDPESSRLSNPPCTLRCRGWNRWEHLCQDPQANIETPFAADVSTRLLAKDSHRPCVRKPL